MRHSPFFFFFFLKKLMNSLRHEVQTKEYFVIIALGNHDYFDTTNKQIASTLICCNIKAERKGH